MWPPSLDRSGFFGDLTRLLTTRSLVQNDAARHRGVEALGGVVLGYTDRSVPARQPVADPAPLVADREDGVGREPGNGEVLAVHVGGHDGPPGGRGGKQHFVGLDDRYGQSEQRTHRG